MSQGARIGCTPQWVVSRWLLFIVWLCAVGGVHAQPCDDADRQEGAICSFDVQIERQVDCSLIITETFVVSRVSGDSELFRGLALLPQANQDITHFKHYIGGSEQEFSPGKCESSPAEPNSNNEDDERRLYKLNTGQGDDVEHKLIYRVSNGSLQFSERCGASIEADERLTIVIFRMGVWNKPIRNIKVTLSTVQELRSATSVSTDGSELPNVAPGTSSDDSSLDELPSGRSQDFYFYENNTRQGVETFKNCPSKNVCPRDSSGGGTSAGIVILIILLVIAALIGLYFIWRRCKPSARRNRHSMPRPSNSRSEGPPEIDPDDPFSTDI